MAGLEDISSGVPSNSESPALGAGRIRTLTDKTKETINLEHYLAGEHKIPSGSLSARPAAGYKGRLFISTAGEEPELQYDNGTQWVVLTKNSDLETVSDDLTTHKTASTLDHPSGSVKMVHLGEESVTSDKIKPGTLVKRHMDGDLSGKQEGDATLKPLIDGSEIDSSWHSHPRAQLGITFISPHTVEGQNYTNDNWTKTNTHVDDNKGGVLLEENFNATNIVPEGATSVLLEARCAAKTGNRADTLYVNPMIAARATTSDEYATICGGYFGPPGAGSISDTKIGFKGQGFCKLNVTEDGKRKFQYKVRDCNAMWELKIIGWM